MLAFALLLLVLTAIVNASHFANLLRPQTLSAAPRDANDDASITLCPRHNEQHYIDVGGHGYDVLCNTACSGDTIAMLTKRSIHGVDSDVKCMAACDHIKGCVAIMMSEGMCFLFDTVDGAPTQYNGPMCARKVSSLKTISSGLPHNSANDTGHASSTGGIRPTGGVFPTGYGSGGSGVLTGRPTSIPLMTVSGGYLPINTNFTGPYWNPHCPGNRTHVHHGSEPCDCHDDNEPTPTPSSRVPVNSANATSIMASTSSTASPVPRPSSGIPVNSANSSTSHYRTGSAPHPVTTVPLKSVSGGYIPYNHNFTVPYFNPHCPENTTHVHHGTQPCDCRDDHSTTVPGHSSGLLTNSANATRTSSPGIATTSQQPSSGAPINSANSTKPSVTTRIPLLSVSGGWIPTENITVPYYNPHCPNNPGHVHHGTGRCDCIDAPTGWPSSGVPINSANATMTTSTSASASPIHRASSGIPVNSANSTSNPRTTSVPLRSVSGGWLPLQNVTVPYYNPHCPNNPSHVHHGTGRCDCIDAATASPSAGAPVNSANATVTTSTSVGAHRVSSGIPINSANSTASAPTYAAASTTSVPLTTVSGGWIPIQHNFTVPYYNPHCPDNPNHVHHGTSPCNCIDAPTAAPSASYPTNSANSSTSRISQVLSRASAVTKSSNSTAAFGTTHRVTTAPALTSVSGGWIPIQHNFTGSYINTHCPGNLTHVHHGSGLCDCGLDLPPATQASLTGPSTIQTVLATDATSKAYAQSSTISSGSIGTTMPVLSSSSSVGAASTAASGSLTSSHPARPRQTKKYRKPGKPASSVISFEVSSSIVATTQSQVSSTCTDEVKDPTPQSSQSTHDVSNMSSTPPAPAAASTTSFNPAHYPSFASSSLATSPTSIAAPICPSYDTKIYTAAKGVQFSIKCNTANSGTIISSAPSSCAQECMASCDAFVACIAISMVNGQCTLLSSVSGSSTLPDAVAAYMLAAEPKPSTAIAVTRTVEPSSTFSTLTKSSGFSVSGKAAPTTAAASPTSSPQHESSGKQSLWSRFWNWFEASQSAEMRTTEAETKKPPLPAGGRFGEGYIGWRR